MHGRKKKLKNYVCQLFFPSLHRYWARVILNTQNAIQPTQAQVNEQMKHPIPVDVDRGTRGLARLPDRITDYSEGATLLD